MTKGYAKKFEMSPLQKNGKFDIMVWTTQTSQKKMLHSTAVQNLKEDL